jgi:hypothetical protein
LFIYFVEFFVFVSSLKEKDWKKISKFECEKDLKVSGSCHWTSFTKIRG